jgi:hypothetical protein
MILVLIIFIFSHQMLENKVLGGALVKHYKGCDYLVMGISINTETGEELVIYRSLYGEYKLWARPRKMFEDTLIVNTIEMERFRFIRFI